VRRLRSYQSQLNVRLDRRRFLKAGVSAAAAAGMLARQASRGEAAGRRETQGQMRTAPPAAETAVVQWDRLALQAIQMTHPGPPMAARALAVLHTCMYDAWAMYDAVALATTAPSTLRQPEVAQTLLNRQQAVSFAAYAALVDLFPTLVDAFSSVLATLGYAVADASTAPGSPADIGTRCAQAVLAVRHSDGSNQRGDLHPGAYSDYTGYQPVNGPYTSLDDFDPNRWQPLIVPDDQGVYTVQQYVGPFWGLVTPFALTSGAQFRPTTSPALYGSDDYRRQADQLLDISANLTDEQKIICEFWALGPGTIQPPGQWCLFGQTISRRDAHDFDTDVQFFFILSNALFDAGIAAWDAKRTWDSIRPISAVHYLYHGQQIRAWGGPYRGTQTMGGEDWLVYQSPTVISPAFPEYISGHSTFSAAAADVLQRFTGDDAFGASLVVPAGASTLEPGSVPADDVTLSWETFSAAAAQAGLSRRYGGIHFERGDLDGRATGRLVAAQVWDRAQHYLKGAR
jgi:hypothetical protein